MTVETSIVIRTLNEAKHLERLMQGIHSQSYRDWEIVLVDSGSSDGTLEIAERYGARIYHIPKSEFTFGRSLNMGCAEARGNFLVFASGHVWPITNNWLKNITRPFEEESIAMVYGRQRGTDANRLAELRDLQMQFGTTSHILVDEPNGNNGNSAIRRDLWERQPFDETLTGLEDVDFARKAEQKGFRVYYAADAPVYHVHEETLPQVYNRYLREAIATKRMFPHYRFTWREFLRGLPYAMVRDVLFAFRHKHTRKLPWMPATRLAHFLGIYRGVRHQTKLTREIARRLKTPDSHRSVVCIGPDQHGLKICETPQVHGEQTLVQVAFANVSGNDHPARFSDNGNDSEAYPMVPGREFSGIVVQNGGGMRKGEKVAGVCIQSSGNGDAGQKGSYAEYVAAAPDHLQRLPLDTPLKHGVLVGTVASCLEGLASLNLNSHLGSRLDTRLDTQKSACVLGAGPVGNICAQLLHRRGLSVTVVDSNERWLSLLDKYEVDTLQEPGPLDRYDYLIETEGDGESLAGLLARSSPAATGLVLGSRNTKSGEPRLVYPPELPSQRHLHEALRLVNSRVVSLEDHTASVQQLGSYAVAWEDLQTGRQFNVLLSVSRELENL